MAISNFLELPQIIDNDPWSNVLFENESMLLGTWFCLLSILKSKSLERTKKRSLTGRNNFMIHSALRTELFFEMYWENLPIKIYIWQYDDLPIICDTTKVYHHIPGWQSIQQNHDGAKILGKQKEERPKIIAVISWVESQS